MLKDYARTLYNASRFCLRNRKHMTAIDAVEIVALSMLALTRAGSPTAKMMIGQVRAKAHRVQAAKGVRHVQASLRTANV
ncbi:hypothetical protein [Ancylobacter amanitiformis]|uniref:Transposase n=1 Tax=Ancylobacter amanitiformis TaxID=217069 RepID=A0ABU0LQC2_9HYPH|nr:hypothetical protein [Ancylobacter amanitiformis]MDQ0510897.1 hypothetical protein [Ancylobacter amanitiformis]